VDVFQLGGRKITLAEVDELIADRTLGHAALTLGVILERICQRYPRIKASDLIGPARTKDIATPRHEAIYLVCKLLQYPSLEAIGHEFSDREHSTIMNSRNKVAAEIEAQSNWGKEVAALESELRDEYLPQSD